MEVKNLYYLIMSLSIIGILFIGGIKFIKSSAHISENVLPKAYNFRIDCEHCDSEIIFDDFLLQYDFSTKSGSITFVLNGKVNKDSVINVHIPVLANKSQLIIKAFSCEQDIHLCVTKSNITFASESINQTNITETEIKTEIIIKYFNRAFYKDEKVRFDIKFNNEIEPSGTFRIYTPKAIRPYPYNRVNSRIYEMDLNFGDTYICAFDCFEPLDGIKYYESNGKHFFMKFNETFRVHEFKFNSINADKSHKKNRDLALGTSFLAGGVILLLQLILSFLKKKIDNDNNRAKFIRKLLCGDIKIPRIGQTTLDRIKKELDNFQKKK